MAIKFSQNPSALLSDNTDITMEIIERSVNHHVFSDTPHLLGAFGPNEAK